MRRIEGDPASNNEELSIDATEEIGGHRHEMSASDWVAVRNLKWTATELRIIDMLQANELGVPAASFKAFTASIRVKIANINSALRKQNASYEIQATMPFKDRTHPIEYKMYRK